MRKRLSKYLVLKRSKYKKLSTPPLFPIFTVFYGYKCGFNPIFFEKCIFGAKNTVFKNFRRLRHRKVYFFFTKSGPLLVRDRLYSQSCIKHKTGGVRHGSAAESFFLGPSIFRKILKKYQNSLKNHLLKKKCKNRY